MSERRELAGNQPLLLSGSEQPWRVVKGAADLFLVRLRDGRPTSSRHPLWRVAEGGLMLPFLSVDAESGEGGWTVLAAGTFGTEVEAVPWDLCAAPPHAQEIASWLRTLQEALRAEPPPQDAQELTREILGTGRLELEPSAHASVPESVVWMRGVEGRALALGLQELELAPGRPALPLGPGAWVDAVEKSLLEVSDAGTRDLRAGIETLHAAALQRFLELLRRDEASHRGQLDRQEAEDRRLVHGALRGLADVLLLSQKTPVLASGDPLLGACSLVGRRLGIELRRPEPSAGSTEDGGLATATGLRGVEEIARASRVRTRKVALEGRWWRTDAGPLLAFEQEDRSPLALLRHRRGYRAVDPATGIARRVGPELHASLEATAVSFYRPFPRRRLTWWDLVRHGSFGLGRDFAIIVLMGLLAGALGLVPPFALQKLVDTIIPAAERPQLWTMVAVLVAAALGAAMYRVSSAVATVRIETRMDAVVQAAVWDRVLELPLPFFRRFNAGDLANRTMGINAIRQAISGSTVTTLLTGAFSLLNVGLMAYYSPRLTLVGLGVVVVLALVTAAGGYAELRYQRVITDLGGRLSGKVLQILKAVAKLRGAGGERRAFSFWAEDFVRQRRQIYRARLIRAAVDTVNAAAPVLAALALFGCFMLWRTGATAELGSGRFLAFLAAFGTLLTASVSAAGTAVDLFRVVPVYERALPILESVPEVAEERIDAGALRGDIEVSHVSFRYTEDTPEVLHDVSLRVAPGEAIAIVGPSGSGKSTLLRLLLGFEQPSSGAVYYDSRSLAELDLGSVRRQVGVVLQGGQLLGGDIFGNIVGALPLTLDDAWEAARMAGLAEDIEAMPMGMHTLIGEAAAGLSGGQRQRLMIAKALVNRPRIVFFDEATSALDNPTQALVAESLDRLRSTRVLIAHRLSTIRHVDRIYVLDSGRIVEHGSYDELMASGGAFAELARRQIA